MDDLQELDPAEIDRAAAPMNPTDFLFGHY